MIDKPDFTIYETVVYGCRKFAKVPFSDWLPCDFEDVNVHMGGEKFLVMHYSPSCHMMAKEVSPYLMPTFYQIASLDYWLKELS